MSAVKQERYAAIEAMAPKIEEALSALGLTNVRVMPHDLGMKIAIVADTNLRWLADEEFQQQV